MGKAVELARVVVTRAMVGICHMQVCAESDATDDEILSVCNSENPSGTTNGWSSVCRDVKPHRTFGDCAPKTCADDPKRTHFLVAC